MHRIIWFQLPPVVSTTVIVSIPAVQFLFTNVCMLYIGFPTQLRVTTSLSTGGRPVSCPRGFRQVIYSLGLYSRLSGVVQVLCAFGL